MAGIVLITGGARGIGAATARRAAAAGWAVAVNYEQRRDAAEAVVRDIEAAGGQAVAVAGDVADEDQVVRMFDAAEAALGRLTGLVNSAGISGPDERVQGMTGAALRRLMEVNVVGLILCCREAARRMSTAHGGKGGAVVNVGSMAATIGGREKRTAYAASKGAVDSFSIGFAREVAREGIRVNVVRPGVTLTDMTGGLREDPALLARVADTIAMDRVASVEELADPIVFLLSPGASFISGARLDVSGGGFMIGGSSPGRP